MKRYIKCSNIDNSIDSPVDIDVHYLSETGYFYGPSFSFKPVNVYVILTEFNSVTGDPNSRYLVLMYHSTIAGTYYDKAAYCAQLDQAKSTANQYLAAGEATPSNAYYDKHYYVNVIDLFEGMEVYFNDTWSENSAQSWATPRSDIKSSVDVTASNYDKYDPYNGRSYRIDCGKATKYTDSPKLALRTCAKFSADNSGDCAIMAKYKDDAILLCEAATPQYLQMLWDTYNPGYKLDWVLEVVKKQLANNCSGFLGDGQYGDQVSPFSYG